MSDMQRQSWLTWSCVQTQEDDIIALLKPAGTVWHLSVPRKPDGERTS